MSALSTLSALAAVSALAVCFVCSGWLGGKLLGKTLKHGLHPDHDLWETHHGTGMPHVALVVGALLVAIFGLGGLIVLSLSGISRGFGTILLYLTIAVVVIGVHYLALRFAVIWIRDELRLIMFARRTRREEAHSASARSKLN